MLAVGVSVTLVAALGIMGPSVAVPSFAPMPPWPPWFFHVHPSASLASIVVWLAVVMGGAGVAVGLVAVRRGWRPRPRNLIIGSAVAVVTLMVVAPMGSGDMLDYAVFGRIAALGHSPYVMTPGKLKATGDPVGAVSMPGYRSAPSRYGPLVIVTESAASELAGDSAASTIFWLKIWNAAAFLAMVLGLDRLLRSDAARRVRAHLLWSVNPLMLWAVMAGGHNDGLAACIGAAGLFALSTVKVRRALLAGVLVGLAAAMKAPCALFGLGPAWATRRSYRTLEALALGAAVVLIPTYLLAGRAAISASMGVATLPPVHYVPWFAVVRVLGLRNATSGIDAIGLIGFVALSVVLVWRIPPGLPDFPVVRVALAVTLAWLVVSPQQRPWYDAMIFVLLAVFPATRLDWIVMARAVAGAVGDLPRVFYANLHPAWLSAAVRTGSAGIVPLALAATGVALLAVRHE